MKKQLTSCQTFFQRHCIQRHQKLIKEPQKWKSLFVLEWWHKNENSSFRERNYYALIINCDLCDSERIALIKLLCKHDITNTTCSCMSEKHLSKILQQLPQWINCHEISTNLDNNVSNRRQDLKTMSYLFAQSRATNYQFSRMLQ